jgi:hypothetical protein
MDTAVKRQGCLYRVFRNKPLTREVLYVELRLGNKPQELHELFYVRSLQDALYDTG